MSGNKKIITDEYFNIRSRPKTKDTLVLKTDFIDDNDNVLLKMESSGDYNVYDNFDGFLLKSHFPQISRRNMHDIARLSVLYSTQTF